MKSLLHSCAALVLALLSILPCPAAAQAPAKNPVIIVGGTMALEPLYWLLRARLAGDGYSAEIFQLPALGTVDIHDSARELQFKVTDVLMRTGAKKVHLIGHSQGGLVARTYVQDFNAASTVESLITLATPHKGTAFIDSPFSVLLGCPTPACNQMRIGSPFLRQLNQRPANDPIFYTNIITTLELIILPFENGQMDSCDRVSPSGQPLRCNITVQQQCPLRLVDHVGLAVDGTVYSGIRNALMHRPVTLDCLAL